MENKQRIVIEERNTLTANYVTDIESLSDEYLVINIKFGKMYVEGKNLKVKDLSNSEGTIAVIGEIISVYFKDEKEKNGIIRRLFK